MKVESYSNPEIEGVTKEEWNEFKEAAHALFTRVISTPSTLTRYSHITRNRAQSLTPGSVSRCIEENNVEGYKRRLIDINILKKYFELIDEFPDFKEKEMSKKEGMFPDLSDTGEESLTIVDKMEKRLKAT